MKDVIGVGRFVNSPVSNPTQTRFSRLVKVPHAPLDSLYNKMEAKMDSLKPENIKTRYSHLLGGGF